MKYGNLRAEMARKGITGRKIATAIGVRQEAVYKKLNGKSPLMYEEAEAIKDTFFPQLSLEYLFRKESEEASFDKVSAGS